MTNIIGVVGIDNIIITLPINPAPIVPPTLPPITPPYFHQYYHL